MNKIKTGHKILNITTPNNQEFKVNVKKHLNRNEYIQIDSYWIRNFNAPDVTPIDINNLFGEDEIKNILANEMQNTKYVSQIIANDLTNIDSLIIVSDGFGFPDHSKIKDLKDNCGIMVLNHAMRFWESPVFPNFMLMNNSTEVALSCMPLNSMPQLIASRRTFSPFIKKYDNNIYLYDPTPDENYQSIASKDSSVFLDEYRNPVCAAISFANFLNIRNIYLCFCSSAYSENRAGTIKIAENAYQYPQQQLADRFIDGNIFWYKFGNRYRQIFYTGLENTFKFAKYLKIEELLGLIS
jgi:hypothetical protein